MYGTTSVFQGQQIITFWWMCGRYKLGLWLIMQHKHKVILWQWESVLTWLSALTAPQHPHSLSSLDYLNIFPVVFYMIWLKLWAWTQNWTQLHLQARICLPSAFHSKWKKGKDVLLVLHFGSWIKLRGKLWMRHSLPSATQWTCLWYFLWSLVYCKCKIHEWL